MVAIPYPAGLREFHIYTQCRHPSGFSQMKNKSMKSGHCPRVNLTSKVVVVRAKAIMQNIFSKKSLEKTKQIQPCC